MTGRRSKESSEAGHIPVLLPDVLACLEAGDGKKVIDGTFGAGGYSRALLERGCQVLAIDRDPGVIAAGKDLEADQSGFRIVQGRFSNLDEIAETAGFSAVAGVVLDIGVSSMQVDQAERGFSFRNNGPLDMRMGRDGASAGDVVNKATVRELATIIGVLGEERKAGRIARAIDKARMSGPITGTSQLADIIAEVAAGRGPARIHPATRTFQALRIFINRELEELALALAAAERVLIEGGRLVIVAFHSLEDRIVKRFLRDRSATAAGSRHAPQVRAEAPTFSVLTPRPIEPDEAEVSANPRARSARLRAAVRTDAPARALDMAAIGVPQLNNVPGPEAFA